LLARLAVTGALLALLAWRIELGALVPRLTRLAPGWVAAAFGAVFAAVALSAWKWGLILTARGHPLPYRRLVRHYLIGLFFNNFLPTTVGGDAVRAWETARDTREVPEAVGSVIADRLVAGAALGATALLGLPFADAGPRVVLLVGGFVMLNLALVGLFLAPGVAERLAAAALPPRLERVREAASSVVAAVRGTVRAPALVARVFVLSMAFQVLVALVNACLFAAMGDPPSLAGCVLYTPIIFTVTMLPISLSGFGVREVAYAYFFGLAGVEPAAAVLASLLFFVVVGFASLAGGPLFALGRGRGHASR
jgi:uncharacterized protein (TIRG00374 family)